MIFLGVTDAGRAVFQLNGDLLVTTDEDSYEGLKLPSELKRYHGSLMLLVEGEENE